ncbi:MAG TPA: hypothetical protein VNJ53_09845 [Gaiellaceae bacterium]|nr:hypothetical protein [Gaiellaceae bacterium]
MRAIACLVTVVSSLVLAGTATAADWPDGRLDAVATAIAGHPVHVFCEADQGAWNAHFYNRGQAPWSVFGFTSLGSPVVYMSPDVCLHLHLLLDFGWLEGGIAKSALAVMTLTHEAIHQRGIGDERETQCLTLQLVGQVAQEYFGLSPTVTVQQPTIVTKSKVVRRKGQRIVVTYRTTELRSVEVANPAVQRFDEWVLAWHRTLPAPYQGC